MFFTKDPCLCHASVALPLLASTSLRLHHPSLYKLKGTLGGVIR